MIATSMAAKELRTVISHYVKAVEAIACELREVAGTHDLLRAITTGALARSGQLKSGAKYQFHGVGCRVETPTFSVDFDLGPDGRIGGFDAWRIWEYAAQISDGGAFAELHSVEIALNELMRQGEVQSPRLPPSPHLFYLATDLGKEAEQ